MATPTDRSRLAEFIGIDTGSDSKKKPLYDPVIAQTGSEIAKVLGVDTPEAARQALYKPVIGPPPTTGWKKAT